MLRDSPDKSEDEQLDLTHKKLNRIFKHDSEAQFFAALVQQTMLWLRG